ncbi:MAG: ChaN family lipoprotein [bacterium]
MPRLFPVRSFRRRGDAGRDYSADSRSPCHRAGWLVGWMLCWLLGLGCLTACDRTDRIDPAPLDPALRQELETWLTVAGAPPVEYVCQLFQRHDVIFLGEQHRIRHDVELVAALLAPLHDRGVSVIATEFARREDQALLDSLVTAPVWDESLARRIIFLQNVAWGYWEYVDILQAAWSLNHELPAGEQPLRMLALNGSPDFSVIKSVADRENPEFMAEVWAQQDEADWAEVVLTSVAAGNQILVHCGIHHAFTRFRQPKVRDGRFDGFGRTRLGNHVYEAIGQRACTVYLHAPYQDETGYGGPNVHPADGSLDAFMLDRSGGPFAVGFDVSDSPLGARVIEHAVYRYGYTQFRLRDFCDGWIYTKPISSYQGMTYLTDWIHDGNLEYARQQVLNPRMRDYGLERFNSALARDADLIHKYGHLR